MLGLAPVYENPVVSYLRMLLRAFFRYFSNKSLNQRVEVSGTTPAIPLVIKKREPSIGLVSAVQAQYGYYPIGANQIKEERYVSSQPTGKKPMQA